MEPVTEEEHQLLQKLRDRISDLNLTPDQDQDKNLVRWLRARKQNLPNAEQMLRKNHAWIQDNHVDDLVSTPDPPGWGSPGQYHWHFCGFDKENNPVVLLRLGEWDVRSALSSGGREKFVKYGLKMIELLSRACALVSKNKAWMSQFVAIYDCKGLSFSQVSCIEAVQVTLAMSQVFDSNYPELLRKGFVVNAPLPFQVLFKLIRPALEERTYRKISVLGSDPEVWKSEIGTLVPLGELPAIYGGEGGNELNMTIGPDGVPCKRVN